MLKRGLNPFVIDNHGRSQFDHHGNLNRFSGRRSKSIFFSVEPFDYSCSQKSGSVLLTSPPWFYQNGVFNGQFDYVIGSGSSGILLHGFIHGVEAAFKFIEVGNQPFEKYTLDRLAQLNRKLGEKRSVETTTGSKIVDFFGHYR